MRQGIHSLSVVARSARRSQLNCIYDQLFKELLTTFFVEFLELFFPAVLEYLDTEKIEFVDKELFTDLVRGEKNILDIVALAKFQELDYSFLIHVENQATNTPEFNRRMFRYFCSLFLKEDRPIYPIVVFSYDRPQRLDKSSFANVFYPELAQTRLLYSTILQISCFTWSKY